MEAMRVSWTDERLDDLNSKVDEMDREMRAEFRAVRSEMNGRFDSLQRSLNMMMGTMIGGFVTLLAATLGVAAAVLTHL
jgi:hypothetical protein